MSTLIGLNAGFFSYQALRTIRVIKWYMAGGLGFSAFVLAKNFSFKNCVDRIYFAQEHIFKRVRSEKEKKESKKQNKEFNEILKDIH